MTIGKHILVGTDFSDGAAAAVAMTADLAVKFGARVTLFHAYDPDPLVPPGVVPSPGQFREQIAKEMKTAIDEALANIRKAKLGAIADVNIEAAVATSAADGIVSAAERVGADLIVVATQGRTGLRHLLIGSVAERVVRHSHCPVLVVRAGA